MFMGPRNWFQGMNSASLCSLAGRYENPIPSRCLAFIDFLKIPALDATRRGEKNVYKKGVGTMQCCWSVTFWYGSGSADPYNRVPNLDSDLAPDPPCSSVTFKMSKTKFFPKFFCFLLFVGTFKQSSKIKIIKKSQNTRNQGFSYHF